MLALTGPLMIGMFTVSIMTKRLTPHIALITIPLVFYIVSGNTTGLDKMVLDGLKMVAPSVALFLFAVLFFGVMFDTGLFDPLIKVILEVVKGDPVKISSAPQCFPWPWAWTVTARPLTWSSARPCCSCSVASA